MSREYYNELIINKLESLIHKHPDIRFCQLLSNLKILEPGVDKFYEESEVTLKKLDNQLNKI